MDPCGKHRIRLSNKIGNGTFGEVYKCTYDGEVCAVKTLPHGVEGDHVAFQMFHREANVLRGCNHERIIQFKALCKLNPDEKRHGGKWALVLEFAKGGTLSDKVVQSMISPGSRVYSTAQALSWAYDVATALEYLHSKSPAVLHRDVKLSNIVLCKEEGNWVAKLSDFGLHVVADGMRDRLLRVSFSRGPNSQLSHFFTKSSTAPVIPVAKKQTALASQAVERASGNEPGDVSSNSCPGSAVFASTSVVHARASAELTQQHIMELQQRLTQETALDTATPEVHPPFDEDSARQQLGTLRKPTAGSTAGAAVSTLSMPGHTQDELYLPGPISTLLTSTAASAESELLLQRTQQAAATTAAAGESTRTRAGPHRSKSFKHGQAGVEEGCGSYPDDGGAQHAAALLAAWGVAAFVDDDGSMCSMVTDGTWVSGDTCATAETADTAAASSDGAPEGSSWTDVETVFNMTGQTGSCLYMAPEVYLNQPYNEKADVFSFGVVLYELMARCMVLFSELPTNSTDPAIADQYASKVSQGYRPSQPKHMPEVVWHLIEACWQQEPARRPSMSKVVNTLQQLLREEQQPAPTGLGRRSYLSSPATSVKAHAEAATEAKPAKTSHALGAASTTNASSTDQPAGSEGQKQCGCVVC